jgi:hypothetical protein
MDKNFYTTPKGYYQIAKNKNDNFCEYRNYTDISGYTFSNGVKT